MSFFGSMNVSASGLSAQRLRMDVISENIANVDTTRTGNGGPYQRKTALFQEMLEDSFGAYLDRSFLTQEQPGTRGVRVAEIAADNTPGPRVYEPGHPDADATGYVTMPNVNIVTEMVNMISASRSYEANITAMNSTKSMIAKTLEISR
jgi:flagellar basal-body rod protein FlgC